MSKKIKVFVKEPNKRPRCVWIANTLENLQSIVGGDIEIATLTENLVVICKRLAFDEERTFCCRFGNMVCNGTIIIAGYNGETEDCDNVPMNYREAKLAYPKLWEVTA